jgi:hypothetical protein
MARRTRPPETKMLHISDGDWLLVKKHLTAGEERALFKGMIRDGVTGDTIDSMKVASSKILTYLLDWSFTDHDDKPIVIRDKSPEDVETALNAITPDDFKEVRDAIDKHMAAMEKERKAEKNGQGGDHKSSPISTSPSDATGVTNGLQNLTVMSTTS